MSAQTTNLGWTHTLRVHLKNYFDVKDITKIFSLKAICGVKKDCGASPIYLKTTFIFQMFLRKGECEGRGQNKEEMFK